MPDIITLSDAGATVARKLDAAMDNSRLHFYEGVTDRSGAAVFPRTADLVTTLFPKTDGMIFIGPCGVIVRALAPHLASKYTDPPAVVLDVLGRWALSLVSGHEGGANALCLAAANILGAEPVITTTTDAARTLIVGVGCRRGCAEAAILDAVTGALKQAGAELSDVRFLATADIKAREPGLLAAAETLGVPLRFISSEEIRNCPRAFTETPLARERVNLPAVAEPSALLAGRRTTLILSKTIINSVTVAVARENSSW
jgi:cobalt-precorrin 5A hydrolase